MFTSPNTHTHTHTQRNLDEIILKSDCSKFIWVTKATVLGKVAIELLQFLIKRHGYKKKRPGNKMIFETHSLQYSHPCMGPFY